MKLSNSHTFSPLLSSLLPPPKKTRLHFVTNLAQKNKSKSREEPETAERFRLFAIYRFLKATGDERAIRYRLRVLDGEAFLAAILFLTLVDFYSLQTRFFFYF